MLYGAGRLGVFALLVVGFIQILFKGLAWQHSSAQRHLPQQILTRDEREVPRAPGEPGEHGSRVPHSDPAPIRTEAPGGQTGTAEPRGPRPVAPWSPQWVNSVAICTTMRGENITDVREWLDYHRCELSPGCA